MKKKLSDEDIQRLLDENQGDKLDSIANLEEAETYRFLYENLSEEPPILPNDEALEEAIIEKIVAKNKKSLWVTENVLLVVGALSFIGFIIVIVSLSQNARVILQAVKQPVILLLIAGGAIGVMQLLTKKLFKKIFKSANTK